MPRKTLAASVFSLAALLVVTSGIPLFGQTETGQITGTVFDPSGAVVTSATVTAVDTSTQAKRTVTPTSGNYVFANLQPGVYDVTAAAPGFQTLKQTVTVAVGSKVGVDSHLTVGATTTILEVSEANTQVNTESQTVGATLSTKEILDLPTLTRNPYALVGTVGNTTDSDPTGGTRGVGFSINGLRASDVGILLDGVPNSNNFDTRIAVRTPLDSVGEITIITSSPTAEYGRSLAGLVNVDTKRGTNALHGTAYEFNRVSALTSNTFDNNANGIGISPFTRNQFGFSGGGAVIKNKLFIFGNPEWIRVRSAGTKFATVVTPELLAASAQPTKDFFQNFGKLKPGLAVLNTFTRGQVCTTGACTAIPANTPIYQRVSYNVPSDSGGGDPQNTLNFAGRVDYNLSNNTQIYFRYARFDASFFPGSLTDSPYVGYDTADFQLNNAYAVSATHIFSTTLISQTKLSFNRIAETQPLAEGPVSPTLYTTLSATNSLGGASILYPGYSPRTPGNSIPFGGPQNYYQLNQDLTKTFGRHNIRFGGLYTYLNDNRTFGAYAEAVAALGTNASSAVNGLVNGQLHDFQAAIYPQGKFPCVGGVVTPDCTLTLPVGPPNFSRSNLVHETGLYAQDSWKVKPRLTVNLGLRWEYFGPQANRDPKLDSNFFFGSGSNIETQSATGKVLLSTDPANPLGGLWHKDYKLFSPRLGVAYDLFGDGKTSIRGGWGLSYVPNFGNVTFNVIQNPPNYSVIALTAGADVATIPITTSNAGPLAGSSGTKPFGIVTLRAVDPYIKTAKSQLWSASVEHQFGSDVIFAVEYTGSKGSDLYTINRLNIPGSQLVYTGAGSATARLNKQYSYINFRTNGGFSNYNSLNFRGELRNFRRQGLSLRANYTWSHAIDNISNTFSETATGSGNLGLLDPLNPGLDKGNAEFDVRHRFIAAAIWDIPFKPSNKALQSAIGGWSLIGNFSARTGSPFSLFDCTNAAYVLCPRAMYDQPFKPVYSQAATGNPNEFAYMNAGTFNSSYVNAATGVSDFGPFPSNMTGRGVFTGPGNWSFDLSVHKTFSVTERYKLQFRAEAFNVFNHSNLYIVNSNTDVSAYGPKTDYVTAQKGVRQDNLTTTENRNIQ
ncbi:MAG TPA: carboxypeptidase regulatory-like domain-containing protein, partial [Bryobacteraceae bacterium]|nr:carboxypeptidase regulatory-like domain-containing protein [Bryobacteraceae bacterium]